MANFRRHLKHGVCTAVVATGLDRIGQLPGRKRPIWVVGYHQVVESAAEVEQAMPGLAVSADMLTRHLEWIARRFHVVTLKEELLGSNAPRDRPLAAVTFDDGYRGAYEHALPILRRLGLPASVFVVTDLVGTSRLLSHDRLFRTLCACRPGSVASAYRSTRALLRMSTPGELEKLIWALEQKVGPQGPAAPSLLPMTWEMLTALREAGIDIGSHTRSHRILSRLDPAQIASEVSESRSQLERHLGAPIEQFAYPDGQFDPPAVDAVAKAGYRFAFTACSHFDRERPWLTLPRTMLWEGSAVDADGLFSSASLSCQTLGIFKLFSGCRETHLRV